MSARYFGAAVTRLEDARLLAGKGQYVDDIELPGMLHAAFVRASFAHGRIRSIDTSDALAMPGVAAIYTMADFVDIAHGPMPPMAPHPLLKTPITYHPLADTEVRHVGEAIAIVLADSRANAEDAAAAVTLDIEYLPAVSDAALACEANSPKTHSQHPSNIVATMKAGFGACAGVFAKADHVLTEHFDIHRGGCHSMECRGVVANIDLLTDALTIATSSQSPYMVRRHLAAYLKRDENDIRVMTPDVGGGFGPKANVYAEEFAVALAVIKSRRPVKWIEDRQEHFVATTQQRGQTWTLDVAFDNDGRMRAIRGRCIHDNGAYAPYGLILPATALASFPGPYALEALDLSLDVVLTNLGPTSPVRGACRPNVAFLLERLADRVARHLGMDRQEVRRRSFVRADQMPYTTGMKARDGSPISYDSGDYIGALNLVLDKIDATNFEDVTVETADTAKFPLGISTIASRIAVTAGSSVQLAAHKVRAKAIAFASHQLEVGEHDLELDGGAVRVKGIPDMKIELSEIARTLAGNTGVPLPGDMEPDLAATAYFSSNALTFAYGANACEVEVDPETGDVSVVRYVVVHDCGRLINPMIVDGQIRGGVVHGIGNALFERMIYDEEGQPLTTTYGDYLLPMASEMPRIEIFHMETPSPRNPIGVKGAGEGGTIPAAACVISAVEDALGPDGPFISFHPISPKHVVTWLDGN